MFQKFTPTKIQLLNTTLKQKNLQGGQHHFGSLKAFFASWPYRLRKQTPQKLPLTPRQIPDRQIVLKSKVFCRHWWQLVPFVSYFLNDTVSATPSNISSVMSSGFRSAFGSNLLCMAGRRCLG